MIEFENDESREEMAASLVVLSRSPVWEYFKSHLVALRNQAQKELMSNEITVDKNLSPLEVLRREINYLDSLVEMPENLAERLQRKSIESVDELDPQKPATAPSPFPQDDPSEPDDTPARPTGGF